MKYYHYTVNTGDLAIHNEHAVDKSIMPQIASWLKESTKNRLKNEMGNSKSLNAAL